jgi:hypothetical protein
MPKPTRPPLSPPPEDAVRLWIERQAAIEHTAEMKRKYPPTEESVAGGIAMPLWDERVVQAMRDEVEASIRFHEHPWWYGAFDAVEAEHAITEAAARLRRL